MISMARNIYGEVCKIFHKRRYVYSLSLAPFLIYIPFFLGLLKGEPLNIYANVAYKIKYFLRGDQVTIDPNIGYTTEALARQALTQIVHGQIPWWNHYEGLGAPLAGEVQSAALFPFILLMLLPCGFFVFQATLQAIAGIATYKFLRILQCSPAVSFVAAILFELNGTFSWLRSAVFNPIPFLPVVLFGIETAYLAYKDHKTKKKGGLFIILGLALSLYAGFPEAAYLDGLLCLGWAIIRFFSLGKKQKFRFAGYIVFSGCTALAISAPFLVSFFDFWRVAYLGLHDGEHAIKSIPSEYLVSLFIPYITGTIFKSGRLNEFWGFVGGYLGLISIILAYCGLFSRKHRSSKIFLFSWLVFFIGVSYGLPYSRFILTSLVPGTDRIDISRYIIPSCEFALVVLCAFGLENIKYIKFSPKLMGVKIFSFYIVIISLFFVKIYTKPDYKFNIVSCASIAISFLFVVLCVFIFTKGVRENRYKILGILCVLEAFLLFVLPILGNAKKVSIDKESIAYLQEHINYNRFLTFGPIAPNYGSFYNIPSINHNDLPVPQSWVGYIKNHLDSDADPILFVGTPYSEPSLQSNFVKNIDEFRKVGVKYIILPQNDLVESDLYKKIQDFVDNSKDIRLMHDGKAMRIYDIGGYSPYANAPECVVNIKNYDQIDASCKKDSVLTRRELFMKGWEVSVNNAPASVLEKGVFQKVYLKKGDNKLNFHFVPPFMNYAFLCFLLGFFAFFADTYRGYFYKDK